MKTWNSHPWASRRRGAIATAALASIAAVMLAVAAPSARTSEICDDAASNPQAIDSFPYIGTGGNDVIVGSSNADHIEGRGGHDLICGMEGDDVIEGDDGRDDIYGGFGDDTIDGDAAVGYADNLHGGPNVDTIEGNAGDDDIYGDGAYDYLYGGTGRDELFGNADGGHLDGQGGGNDECTGVPGANTISDC